jgi:hypothetical protein
MAFVPVGGYTRATGGADMSYVDRDATSHAGRPLIATLVACLIALVRIAAPADWRTAEQSFDYKMGFLFAGAIVGVIMWGIAWAITIRKAHPGWWAGSLIAIALVNVFVSLVQLGAPHVQLERQIAESRAQVEQALAKGDALEGVKVTPDAAPLVRMQAALINGSVSDARAFDTEAAAAGMGQLSLEVTSKRAPVLAKCEQMAAVGRRALAYYTPRIDAHLREAEHLGRAAVTSGELPTAGVDGFLQGARDKRAGTVRRWQIRAGLAEASASICRTLRDRPWVRQKGQILFTHQRGLDAVNSQIKRTQALAAEEETLVARARSGVATELKQVGTN